MQIEVQSRLVSYGRLIALGKALLRAHAVSEADSRLVATLLVESNLRGIDSHGIARLPHYLSRIQQGSIRPAPKIRVERRAPACAVVDGDDGLGHVVATHACDVAVSLAREAGAGWVAIKNSSHCGALAAYGLRMASENMIGFVFTHVDPMVLPHGAREPFCGTNPICIAIPGGGDDHLCLDMATSVVPWNTISNAAIEGVDIPQGWAVDKYGEDTTDPSRVAALYPAAGHKGSGLGLMIDALCAFLGGAPIGPDIPRMYGDLKQRRQLGGLIGAIDISRFGDPATVRSRVSQTVARWTALAPALGFDRVLYPGQPEVETRRQRIEAGVPIGLKLCRQLNEIATRHQLTLAV